MADEVGFLMNPSVKRTWAPKAKTPVIAYRSKRSQKVSVLGAVVLHAAQTQVDLVCDFHPDSYVRGGQAAAFVHRLLAEYPNRTIDLVWDNLNAHKSKLVKELLSDHPRLTFHYLPPYAPDLNASEGIWCQAKHHRMANHTIDRLDQLLSETQRHLNDIAGEQRLLQACFKEAGLALYQPSAQ